MISTLAEPLAALVALITGLCASHWWTFRQGKEAGKREARQEALKEAQAETDRTLREMKAELARLHAEVELKEDDRTHTKRFERRR